MTETVAVPDWHGWQRSWDRQQEWYMPDREERFRVMLETVEALTGPEPVVLDLACGTGSISERLLRALPGAHSTGVDLDPALLAIARGHFEADARVRFVTADLRDPRWTDQLPYRQYDAVLTATALHWLPAEELRTLYGQLAGVVRDGGVFLNADHMPDPTTPRINAAQRDYEHARQRRDRAGGALDWADWWLAASRDPALADRVAERFRTIGNPTTGDHADGESLPVGWHTEALRAAGFDEVRPVWRSVTDALVLALK